MARTESTQSVDLPNELVTRVENRIRYTEFESTEKYIINVLEEVLYHIENETDDENRMVVDEQEVQDRLRSLGYLDR